MSPARYAMTWKERTSRWLQGRRFLPFAWLSDLCQQDHCSRASSYFTAFAMPVESPLPNLSQNIHLVQAFTLWGDNPWRRTFWGWRSDGGYEGFIEKYPGLSFKTRKQAKNIKNLPKKKSQKKFSGLVKMWTKLAHPLSTLALLLFWWTSREMWTRLRRHLGGERGVPTAGPRSWAAGGLEGAEGRWLALAHLGLAHNCSEMGPHVRIYSLRFYLFGNSCVVSLSWIRKCHFRTVSAHSSLYGISIAITIRLPWVESSVLGCTAAGFNPINAKIYEMLAGREKYLQ